MSYFGSKGASGLYKAIIACMPRHDIYIETHLGSGVVLKNKPKSQFTYGLDLSHDVILNFKKENTNLITTNDINILSIDCIDFLDGFISQEIRKDKETLIYADPPYLLSTRTSRKRYECKYTEADHINLLKKLIDCSNDGINIMLSGYPSSLYDDTLDNWYTLELQAMTRGGVRTEKIWMNFDYQNCSKYWSTFAGNNFTDRQRIKRKALRWAKNYSMLRSEEQIAILAALLSTHQKGT